LRAPEEKFGCRKEEIKGGCKNYTGINIICKLHVILLGRYFKDDNMFGACNTKEKDQLEDLGVGGMITGKMDPSIIILGSDMGNLIKRVLPT
jgi:hypothetical protein